MTEPIPELELIGRELTLAFRRRLERRRRAQRSARVVAAVVAAFGLFSAVAIASGVGDDLQLDPTKWTIFERGSVDAGEGAYVKAHAVDGSGDSTFLVEHDAALQRYDAFLLHERLVSAAGGGGHAVLCTPEQLTRAEMVALTTLRSSFPERADPSSTRAAVDQALRAAFGPEQCRGLEYAGERARFVYAEIEPRTMLMPKAR